MTKFLHVMPHVSTVYNKQIIEMINSNPDFFNPDEHLFILAHQDVYDDVKHYKNTKFEPEVITNHKIIETYATQAQYIFLHENQTIRLKTMLKLQRKTLHRIIWCIWGHDLYPKKSNSNTLLHCIYHTFKYRLRHYISKQFYAIGIGFKYDAEQVKQLFKKIKILYTPYGYVKNQKKEIDKIAAKPKPHNFTRVMIGHSAYPFLNHKFILGKLSKYKNENLKISLVLAYGDQTYAEEIKEYALQIFNKEKIEIIDTMTNHLEYLEYLKNVDVCILDFKHQAALGNFYILCYLNKKIYLNKDGILKKACDAENIQTRNVDDIDKITFEEFIKPFHNNENEQKLGLYYIDDNNYLKIWKETLKSLE